ncbi:unnamed protein product [Bemisia tabaci]|uniref:Uncharacterized protein n=1 Tax=Bemisia tabaci TaxID=7038 RepID=A0A9P0F2I4_BEMTA|nr:unnamed protein product [Bemisia tabaci]
MQGAFWAEIEGKFGRVKLTNSCLCSQWGPQREKEHEIYVAATNDPCILTGWSANDEQWQLVGERETSGRATPDNLCKSALKSFKEIHWSEQADCVNPIGAKCNKDQKCVLTVPGSSNHCYGRKPCTVHFKKCAKTVIDTHKKFLEKEKKLLEDTNAPKLKGPCNCPHCRRCPMRIYGCPFCPHFPKKVDRLEMQGEDNYPTFRELMEKEKMKLPCGVPKPTSQLRRPASEPPLNNQPVFPYFTGGPIPGPTSLSKTYSTQ